MQRTKFIKQSAFTPKARVQCGTKRAMREFWGNQESLTTETQRGRAHVFSVPSVSLW